MYSFRNDYSEGAHPQVLQALTDTNLVQTCGYGVDPICEEARDGLRRSRGRRSLPGRRHPDQPDGHHGAAGLL